MKRIQVSLSDEMVSRVDKLAESYGVTRSALCSTYIGQMVDGTEKARKLFENPELTNSLLGTIVK